MVRLEPPFLKFKLNSSQWIHENICADHVHELKNPVCGDQVTIQLNLGRDNCITQISFDGRGCVVSQAAASMLCEVVEGKTANEVCALPGQFVLDMIGVPLSATRVKCALLGLEALKQALACAAPTSVAAF